MVVNDKFFYFPWEQEYILTPLDTLLDLIKNNSNKTIVLYNPEEHDTFHNELQQNRELIESTLNKFNCKLEVWVGDFGFNQQDSNNIKFINWPLFLLYSTCTTTNMMFEENKIIDKLGVSLNNLGHDFRCQFIDKLAKYNVLDDMYYTWHHTYTGPSYAFKYFKPKVVRLKEESDLGFKGGTWDQYHVPREFHKGLVHVINESTINKLDISEKTWLAIIHKKPFILSGIKGIHQVLTDLGFKNYTDLFDYEFDNYDDYDARLESIGSQLAKLKGKNYQKLYNSQLPIIEHNYNRLMEIFTNNIGVPETLYDYIGTLEYFDSPVCQGIKENLDKLKS